MKTVNLQTVMQTVTASVPY